MGFNSEIKVSKELQETWDMEDKHSGMIGSRPRGNAISSAVAGMITAPTDETAKIADYKTYNGRMEMSLIDKLFFVDKIDTDLVVDFGCADGALLKQLKILRPDLHTIGYDNDSEMVKFSSDMVPITAQFHLKSHVSSTIVLSSVIHEIFHYCSRTDITEFWSKIFDSGFKYIVIRDMLPSRGIDRVSNINDVKKVYHKFLGSKALSDFERVWGSVESNRQLIHFLLKYRYTEPNWDREVRENYIPLTREELLSKIPMGYDAIFHEHYVLPFIWSTVKKDVGIELKDPTHLKLILCNNSK